MSFNKKFFTTGGIVASTPSAPAGLDPLQNFETVTYTGNGSTQKITGYIRKGAAFNGSSSKIAIPDVIDFSTGEHTISAWVYFTDTTTSRFISNFYTGTVPDGSIDFVWIPSSNSINIDFTIGGLNYTNTITSISTGQWYHIAVTFVNNGTCTAYLNGSSVDTVTAPSFTASSYQALNLGYYSRSNDYWSGKLDQVRIFNRALLEDNNGVDEIQALADETYADPKKSTTDYFEDNSGIALYELDEDANDTGRGTIDSGQSAVFNGSTSQIQATDAASSSTAFSLSAWINVDNTTTSNHILSKHGSTAASRKFIFRVQSGGAIRLLTYDSSGALAANATSSSGVITAGTWHHVVAVENSGTTTVYVDENSVATDSGSSNANTTATANLNFGGRDDFGSSSNERMDGKIDQVRVYNTALSSGDVTNLFNESNVPTANLVAHYKLDGDATDETTNYDGTWSGTEAYSDPAEFPVYNGTPTNINFLGMAFQPDLVWMKGRSDADNNEIYDSVRGATKAIGSNYTNAEATLSTGLTSFDSNGFTLGSRSEINRSSSTYVAWCWKAADTTTTISAGTVGNTIASDVRANQDAGFSIVKYTGNNTAGATVGHGLSSTPEMIIIKNLENTVAARNWAVYHSGVDANPENYFLRLNTTIAKLDYDIWNDTPPTSTVFSLGNTTNVGEANDNNNDHIAYCFHSVDGYQKVGSYTGTGTSSNVVYTDSNGDGTGTGAFEPRWLMIKKSSGTSRWRIVDSVRDTSNPRSKNLFAEDNIAETGRPTYTTQDFNFLSNGFEIPANMDGDLNGLNDTFIYLAIA